MLSLSSLATKIFGNSNERQVKSYRGRVAAINALEPEIERLSDAELRAKTVEFRERLANGAKLDELLVEAFAVVREGAKRSLGQRHFDVQLIGGMVLHDGKIAEMKTGEGKTLVATLPVYLNALLGRGVHVVTVNDYLAKRDSEWMGQVYKFLGLSVGCIVHDLPQNVRREQYAADVTYGTNNELGFDYLRDNMEMTREAMVQFGGRPIELQAHAFGIVDEVDSILVDEARTPLIISGPTEDRSDQYISVDAIVLKLDPADFETDLKARQVTLTEIGNEHIEELLREAGMMATGTLYDFENVRIVHHVNQALKAHTLFQLDKDYIVRNNEVVIIDEFTGRMMPGRRYADGLHQALEAKEHAAIQPENRTLASITFQNFFRLYEKLAGMTGTASTEANEFREIYGLEVVEIPTNVDVSRLDDDDEVYRTAKEKYWAIANLIKECRETKQPVLVGTTSIEKSETLARLLSDKKFLSEVGMTEPIPHQVLNARYHEQEAKIIAQAGVPGAVTIATNMAGRGTDIQLGGNAEYQLKDWLADETAAGRTPSEIEIEGQKRKIVAGIAAKKKVALDAGGLYVIGTERHESRRIDNQLRGRSGRQGDPGHSKFFLALDDDLMKIFGSDRMDGILQRLGLEENEAITHPWINKALEKAQQKVEARNFDARKYILKYDDVMNDQRKVIFEQRIDMMADENVGETITEMREQIANDIVDEHIPANAYAEQWDSGGLAEKVKAIFGLDLPIKEWAAEEGIAEAELKERIQKEVEAAANKKAEELGAETMTYVEKMVLLNTLDHLWREHIVNLEHLREVIGLRGYAQRDPLNEYKTESFELFQAMLGQLRQAVTGQLMHVELRREEPVPNLAQPLPPMQAHHIDPLTGQDEFAEAAAVISSISSGGMLFDDEEPDGKSQPLRKRKAGEDGFDTNDPATWGRTSRNAPCPCGSGKKYKHCHGKI